MRVIAVANTKGGAGKTTVATHLAAYFARQGASVGLSDLDKQRCADGWIERRPADLPRIRAVELPDDPRDLSKKVDVLVIDVPAGAKRECTEALVLVSHAVVRNELFHHRETILGRIRAVPGCEGVKGINLRMG